jgi:hypothetical protein
VIHAGVRLIVAKELRPEDRIENRRALASAHVGKGNAATGVVVLVAPPVGDVGIGRDRFVAEFVVC